MKKCFCTLIILASLFTSLYATVDIKLGGGIDYSLTECPTIGNSTFSQNVQFSYNIGYSLETKKHWGFSTELCCFANAFSNGYDIYLGGAYTIPLTSISEKSKLHLDSGYSTCYIYGDGWKFYGGNGIQVNAAYIHMLNKNIGFSFGIKNRLLFYPKELYLKYPAQSVGDFYRHPKMASSELSYFSYNCNPSVELIVHLERTKKKNKNKEVE